jgi:hypothetical protein
MARLQTHFGTDANDVFFAEQVGRLATLLPLQFIGATHDAFQALGRNDGSVVLALPSLDRQGTNLCLLALSVRTHGGSSGMERQLSTPARMRTSAIGRGEGVRIGRRARCLHACDDHRG